MLKPFQLQSLFETLGISEAGRRLIEEIRISEPARRVGGGASNVCVRYPSRKMGRIIQAESHKVELPFIYEMEHDPKVFEYYDQPTSLKMNIKGKGNENRNFGFFYTPDFLVIGSDCIQFVECKSEDDLKKLAEKKPNRYRKNEEGIWICPPGQEAVIKYGIEFRVWSSNETDWVFHDNIRFLKDYFDEKCPDPASEEESRIISIIRSQKAVSLSSLIRDHKASSDAVYRLIALERLAVNIREVRLREPDKVLFFSSPAARAAYESSESLDSGSFLPVSGFVFAYGSKLEWDGSVWTVANVGARKYLLQASDGRSVSLLHNDAIDLFEKGEMAPLTEPSRQEEDLSRRRVELLEKTSEDDLAEAMRRFERLGVEKGGKIPSRPTDGISRRTFYRLKAQYLQFQHELGDGIQGLVPKSSKRGNRHPKLPGGSCALMHKIIEEIYESKRQVSIATAHRKLSLECERSGLPVPSYKTFRKAVKMRPKENQSRKRKGNRAAYSSEAFFWNIDGTTPRHGTRPFEICHIDHTELDIELVASDTNKSMGRPWLTLMIDAYSRVVVGFYLTFDPPSTQSCMMVLRDCVRRFRKLPQTLVLDNGKEFQSVAFEALLAAYECEKKSRPPAKARFGSVCERFFGKTNTELLYGLAGNTQITKNVRQVTKSVNPKNLAVWTLSELYRLLEEYLFEIYPSMDHLSLGDSPKAVFDRGLLFGGERAHKIVLDTEEFRMRILPSSPRGTGKIDPNTGIQVQYIRYWHDCFRDPDVAGQSVSVKYDPEDASVIYAFIRGRWVQCLSENSGIFRGKSRKEILLASRELSRQMQVASKGRSITAGKLAHFLESALETEETLRQRRKDAELTRSLKDAGLSVVEGSYPENPLHRPDSLPKKENLGGIIESLRRRSETTPRTLEEF